MAWAVARAATAAPRAARAAAAAFIAFGAMNVMYGLASIVAFRPLGGFLTYSLLQLVGNVRMIGSSVRVYLTVPVVLGLIVVPLTYLGLVFGTVRVAPHIRRVRARAAVLTCVLAAWIGYGQHVFASDWFTHGDWRIAENAPWVLVSSWWEAKRGGAAAVRLGDAFDPGDLTDFAPPPGPASSSIAAPASARPPNVLFIVLESVSARWTSVAGGRYDTTPVLKAEAAHGALFENFYAHVGRSSNALAAMLLSVYPKLDFVDFTEEFPGAKGTSLASLYKARGYRTAFITPSDMAWAGWRPFLEARGFDEVRDHTGLGCGEPLTTWGVEDRCMVDGILTAIHAAADRPFFVMGWTTQTHHPYEPSPGAPMLKLLREATPDDYDLERYLNVLHETDRQLGRLFDDIRQSGLADDTLIVVAGDHGQAFGYPHDSYTQGRTAYEEDVHVPLLIAWPRLSQVALDRSAIGAHVDLPPTIAGLTRVPAPAEWQGRSLLDPTHPPRAYFYVAQDQFKLGMRENNWKYIYDLRAGLEELYDLPADPDEQHNVAAAHRDLCARMRQRLAAWAEANRRQYQ